MSTKDYPGAKNRETDPELLCDVTGDGCGHHIDRHPVIIKKARNKFGGVFSSRCDVLNCGCMGYVTPTPPPLPGEIDEPETYTVPAEMRRTLSWKTAA